MKEELGLIRGLLRAPVNRANHEFPVSRENSALKRDNIAYLPAEPLCGFPADNRAFSVAEKGLLLFFGDDEFRKEFHGAPCFPCEILEKVFFININTAEPV